MVKLGHQQVEIFSTHSEDVQEPVDAMNSIFLGPRYSSFFSPESWLGFTQLCVE